MRLIDADALQTLFNDVTTSLLGKAAVQKDAEHAVRAFLMTTEMIQDAPTVDAVPVVRCRDCKHFSENYSPYFGRILQECDHDPKMVAPEDFCSYGERKEAREDVHKD